MRFAHLALFAGAVIATTSSNTEIYTSPASHLEQSPTAGSIADANVPSQTIPLPDAPSPTSPTLSREEYDRLPDALKQFIIDMSPQQHVLGRQNVALGGGQAPASPTPTQLSPITTYNIGHGDESWSQPFPLVNQPLPTPSAGTIGLGSIVGQVGVVRTYNAAPTAHVDKRVMMAVIGGVGAGLIL